MKKQISEEKIIQLSQQYLDQSIEHIDASISSRLKISRQRLLQKKPINSAFQRRVGLVLASALLLVMFWQMTPRESAITTNEFLLVEEMMRSEENQDIVNDLEFYLWLDHQVKQGELV